MRIGIVALLQESNTFSRDLTRLDDFRQDLLAVGEQVAARLAEAHHEVGGFIEGCLRSGMEPVGLLAARALPGGVLQAECFERLQEMLFGELDRAGPLDGLLVAPHGATVAEQQPDADGCWLAGLRARIGPDVPILGTLDPHANLSTQMVEATDALIPYRTNPHVDQRACGLEAAELMARTLRGEIRPVQAAAYPPLAINIERQCTAESPCRELMQQTRQFCESERLLSAGVLFGFPYADVPEMGSAMLCLADGDRAAAQRAADRLAEMWWQRRHELVGDFLGVDEALDRAERLPPDEPVCLLDMGDNVGGGAPADGTLLAAALLRRGPGPAFVALRDPRAEAQARQAGCGAHLRMEIGGRSDPRHGRPLEVDCTVVSLHEGRFEELQARHGGWNRFDMGPTAIIRTLSGLTIQLTTHRVPPWSLGQLTHCGLDPRQFRLLVAKGVNAPLAAYREVCPHVIRVNTPGVTSADMRQLEYSQRRRPLFPFEPEASYVV